MKRAVFLVAIACLIGCSNADVGGPSAVDSIFEVQASEVCYGDTFLLDDAPVAVCNSGFSLCPDYDGGTSDQCCESAGTCNPSNPEHGICVDPLCDGKWVTTVGSDICDTFAEPCPETSDCPTGCLASTKCTVISAPTYSNGCVDENDDCVYCESQFPVGGFADTLCEIKIEVCRCEIPDPPNFGPNCSNYQSRTLVCTSDPSATCSF